MSEIERLTELFMRFPGIGPRQARRFVYFLLRQDEGYRTALTRAIADVVAAVAQCPECQRYAVLYTQPRACSICADPDRSSELLVIVEKDTDVEQLEKSGAYSGRYFVLGGALSLTNSKQTIREKELSAYLKAHGSELSEIILALSATPDGEHTAEYLRDLLRDSGLATRAVISTLGRGLSTGSELEYADAATLKSALENRSH